MKPIKIIVDTDVAERKPPFSFKNTYLLPVSGRFVVGHTPLALIHKISRIIHHKNSAINEHGTIFTNLFHNQV
jgi:hypothetical protein